MKILQYGSMAKVLSPPELIKRLQTEIIAMADNYREDENSYADHLEITDIL
jgi:predicted DNA-binding transcriptional regulator YafY